MNDNQMIIENENGKEEIATILFTFHSEEFNKDYVIFELSGEVTAAIYYPDNTGENGTLDDIETDEEWDLIDALVEDYFDRDDEE